MAAPQVNASARFLALEILASWQEKPSSIDLLMERVLNRQPTIDPRDSQLTMALVYGVLRWQGYLDWLLAAHASHPLAKMKPATLQALRIGLFQLLFLDRVPPSAAINETIEALRQKKQPKWLLGFVNGVLRALARQLENLPRPGSAGAAELPFAARCSHPPWLLARWCQRYGEEATLELCRLNNTPAPLCLRANREWTTPAELLATLRQAGLPAEAGRLAPEAIRIPEYHGRISALPGFQTGLFQVQDEIAQLIGHLLGPFKSGRYLDGCAGLGGKTSHLAQLLPAGSELLAVEPEPRRATLLQANLARLGLGKKVTVFKGTLAALASQEPEPFHAILIDAPCSGLGVVRRHPDIRWNRQPEDLRRFPTLQLALLAEAAQLLTPRGYLVYATCSMEPEENEEVINAFLASHADFIPIDCRHFLPAAAAELVGADGFCRSRPQGDISDGFFAARLQRK